MSAFLITLALGAGIVLIVFAGIGIRTLLKGEEFKRSCSAGLDSGDGTCPVCGNTPERCVNVRK